MAVPPRRRVVVLAGPSGSGKSRLATRLGLPLLRLDDFYRDGDDPALPRLDLHADGRAVVDWDDPASWDAESACDAIETLCRTGRADVPVYEIAANRATARHEVDLGGHGIFVAEGLFAAQVVAECRRRDLLAAAVCLHHPRSVTFVLRLMRDLREHRKPPHVLLRRGWRLMRDEPRVVSQAVEAGCAPMSPRGAERRIRALVATSAIAPGRAER